MKHYPLSRQKLYTSFLAFALLIACAKTGSIEIEDDIKNTIVIDLNDRKQAIRNFGASDAWACQFVGLWSDKNRNQIADWLFSMEENVDGKPEGIGLSLWRFNIG